MPDFNVWWIALLSLTGERRSGTGSRARDHFHLRHKTRLVPWLNKFPNRKSWQLFAPVRSTQGSSTSSRFAAPEHAIDESCLPSLTQQALGSTCKYMQIIFAFELGNHTVFVLAARPEGAEPVGIVNTSDNSVDDLEHQLDSKYLTWLSFNHEKSGATLQNSQSWEYNPLSHLFDKKASLGLSPSKSQLSIPRPLLQTPG